MGEVLRGIDISNHNGPADFSVIRQAGYSFAILKAGEGGNFVDRYFAPHWPRARAAGLVRGAYYYAHPNRSAGVQADHFASIISAAGGLADGDLPPALDFEETKGVTDKAALAAWAHGFLDRLETRTGRVPMLYTYPDFWRNAVGDPAGFDRYPLWYASYSVKEPRPPRSWQAHAIWQHSANGRVPGVGAPVDLNLAPAENIARLTGGTVAPTPPQPRPKETDMVSYTVDRGQKRRIGLPAGRGGSVTLSTLDRATVTVTGKAGRPIVAEFGPTLDLKGELPLTGGWLGDPFLLVEVAGSSATPVDVLLTINAQ